MSIILLSSMHERGIAFGFYTFQNLFYLGLHMRKVERKIKGFWGYVPPWFIVGAAAVLFPIFGYMTLENIHRQKQHGTRLLLEKGAALIRSFEAGTRSGITGSRRGEFELQRLLKETAQQPDIVYLLVADADGKILAHSNTDFIGKNLNRELDSKKISLLKAVDYRIVQDSESVKVFEVFRRFSPTGNPWPLSGKAIFHQLFRDSPHPNEDFSPPPLIIFVGLDMTSVEEARKSDMFHTIIMGFSLLFVGLAGILMLYLAQNYRAARASLSKIKAFSDTLVENIPIGLLAIDNEKKIASLNAVAENVLGVSFEDIAHKSAGEALPRKFWRQVELLEYGSEGAEKEIECAVPDRNDSIPLEISAAPLKDEHGAALGSVVLFKDLTEVKSLQKEIIRNQRLASIGRLAAGVAHEIRNPLSSIKGFATYFKERYRGVPQDFQTAAILIQEVDRLNRVVGQLLELARPVKIVKSLVPADILIETSLELIRRQAVKSQITIYNNVPKNSPNLYVDQEKIRQVLLNLYINAIDSMEQGNGKKFLSISMKEPSENKNIEIHVADSGAGISSEDLSHVFDPFFTRKAGGTGLGLAIVHNIMEAHGGDVKAESQKGGGTTIILTFSPEGQS